MGKTIKMISLFALSLAIILGAADGADAKKKKNRYRVRNNFMHGSKITSSR